MAVKQKKPLDEAGELIRKAAAVVAEQVAVALGDPGRTLERAQWAVEAVSHLNQALHALAQAQSSTIHRPPSFTG